MRGIIGYFSIFAIVVGALLLLVRIINPNFLQNTDEQAHLVYLLLLLVLVGGGAFGTSRAQISLAIRQGILWLAIFVLLLIGYSFRGEFAAIGARLQHEIMPAAPIELAQKNQSAIVAIGKSDDGHFRANARVNKAHVKFLIDTGASSIALTLADARRAGFSSKELNYILPIQTASGQSFGAPVILERVSIGQITLRKVEAIVIKEGLSTSLLGMSFLGRLQKFEASKNQLVLKK